MERQRRANGKKIPAQALKKAKRERKMNLIFTILVVAVVISIFSMISAAVSRFDWKIDLTEDQVFQLTDTTKELMKELDQDVRVVYCNDQGSADSNIEQVLSRYAALSSHIDVEYVDLTANPSLVEEYAQRGITLSEDGVLVICGNNAEFIQWSDLYEIKTYSDAEGNQKYSLTGLRAETKLTASIVAVTTAEPILVGVVAGHSESVPDALTELLENNNYETQQIVLGVNDIPEETRTLVIAGAKRDFSQKEIELLETFMQEGGNLMVFRDPEVEVLPNLDGYLKEWGLGVEDRIVLEPSQQMDSPLNIIPNFGLSMINQYFSQQSTYLVLPQCRQLTIENTNNCITNEVLRSTSKSYGKNFKEMDSLTRTEEDTAGPFTVAATSERSWTDAEGESQTQYVFLTACTGLYQEMYLETQSLGNADFVLQVLAYMNDSDTILNIPTKNLAADSISISWSSTVLFAAVFLILVPLGLLTGGAVMFFKRRHS